MTTIEVMRNALKALENPCAALVMNVEGVKDNLRREIERLEAEEPVGEVGTMPGTSGFTMACFRADFVPVGTNLYTAPVEPVPRALKMLEPSTFHSAGLAPHMTREAQQASSWRMVCATLDEVLPDWLEIESGLDITQSKAVCAIHHLASRRPPTAPAIPALTPEEVRGFFEENTMQPDQEAAAVRWAYALAAERAGVQIKEEGDAR